ncbi:TonB-dependent receptor [Sphingomonas naasensis]|nr:TonB-dependent receptor [Sphingomonas naasensis]NIJ20289.1 TonB-dependent receptor [Sphingomonas naasensis]
MIATAGAPTRLLVSCSAFGLMIAAQTNAQAQTTATAQTQTLEPGTPATTADDHANDLIVVTGTRASLQGAIERKKNSGTTVDSIVAEDIASFPDKNVGEALSRVTGVQLSRDFGEGVAVSIRGVEPDLNRVEINGVTTLGQGGTGQRGADFRELASELVKSIDVYKGVTADLTEGGIGGTVSIQTRRPLDLRKPFAAFTASAQYHDTSDTLRPRGNLTIGTNKLLGGKLGVIVNLTYDNSVTRNDYLRNTAWARIGDLNGDNKKITSRPAFDAITTLAGCAAVPVSAPIGESRADCQQQFYEFVPAIPRYGLWIRDDERISGVATVQYQLTDRLDIYAEYQRNRRNNHLTDYNYQFTTSSLDRIDRSNNCASCTFDDDGNLIGFFTAPTATTNQAGAAGIFRTEKRDFSYVLDSDYRTLGFNWVGERFQLRGFGVKSKGTTTSYNKSLLALATIPRIRIDLDPGTGAPSFTFPTGVNPADPATYQGPLTPQNGTGACPTSRIVNCSTPLLGAFQWRPEQVDVTEDQYKLDADWETGLPFLKSIEFGGQYRTSTSIRFAQGANFFNSDGTFVPTPYVTSTVALGAANSQLPFPSSATNPAQGTVQTFTAAKWAQLLSTSTELTPNIFFNTGDRAGLPDNWLSPNFTRLGDYFDTQYLNQDRVRMANGVAQTPAHDIREDIYAGYLKGNFRTSLLGMPFSGNLGVRWVQTRDTSTGSNVRRERRPSAADPTITETVTVSIDTISLRNRYTDVLPSFNAALELVPDKLMLRVGAAKVMARPKPTLLAPNINCLFDLTSGGLSDSLNDTCTAGNPALKPYRANQYDLNVGWYPNRDTLVSAAFFYKDIKSFIVENSRTFNVDLFGDGELFDLVQPINAAGAKIRGVELSAQTAFTFLPAPFDGLGSQVNYTYSSASNTGLTNALTLEALPYPGLSNHNYSLIGYYDKGALNARVAYTWRSEYLVAVADASGNPLFRKASGYLDAKITLRFLNDRLQFFVEGKNLTGTTETAYAGGIRSTDISYPGKRFFWGISARY